MILGFEWISEKIEMIFLISAEYSLKTHAEEINMTTTQTFNVGEMNSLLKDYTDALLTLHGIPLTDYSHKVSGEAMVAEFTARKTLATAMWQLHEQAQAQADEINHLTEKNEQLETDFIAEQHRATDNHFKAVRLATTVKDLRDHIADCRGDADERAERYEAILEKADEALKKEFPLPSGKFCRPKKFRDYSPYNTEEEDSDEETDEETDEE